LAIQQFRHLLFINHKISFFWEALPYPFADWECVYFLMYSIFENNLFLRYFIQNYNVFPIEFLQSVMSYDGVLCFTECDLCAQQFSSSAVCPCNSHRSLYNKSYDIRFHIIRKRIFSILINSRNVLTLWNDILISLFNLLNFFWK